jgi:hypothetical protein
MCIIDPGFVAAKAHDVVRGIPASSPHLLCLRVCVRVCADKQRLRHMAAHCATQLTWAENGRNCAAALKGKLGKDVSHALKAQQATNNMNVANTYAVMNLLSAAWTLIVVLLTEASTISKEWEHATKKVAGSEIIKNVALSGFFFYLYNELAFLVCCASLTPSSRHSHSYYAPQSLEACPLGAVPRQGCV